LSHLAEVGAAPVFMDMTIDSGNFTAENRPVSPNSRAGNFAPSAFSKRAEREGYNKKDFQYAMERLTREADRSRLVAVKKTSMKSKGRGSRRGSVAVGRGSKNINEIKRSWFGRGARVEPPYPYAYARPLGVARYAFFRRSGSR
jgi:hypothetical protein